MKSTLRDSASENNVKKLTIEKNKYIKSISSENLKQRQMMAAHKKSLANQKVFLATKTNEKNKISKDIKYFKS